MSEEPKRIQRKRTRGWKMPEGVVYVGRPTKWGNPFRDNFRRNAYLVVEEYRQWLQNNPHGQAIAAAAKVELKGFNLACWCKEGDPCHADVLLQIANETAAGDAAREGAG